MNPSACSANYPPAAHYRAGEGEALEPHQLCEHLQEVAALSRGFARKIGLADAGEILGLLHDLGKYGKLFQSYLSSSVGLLNQDEDGETVDAKSLRGKIDHSTAGAQYVWQHIPVSDPTDEFARQILALCLASHHSGLVDCLTSSPNRPVENNFLRRINKPAKETHFLEVQGKAAPEVIDRAHCLIEGQVLRQSFRDLLQRITQEVQAQKAGRTVLHHQFGLVARFLLSCLIDADRMDTADFMRPGQRAMRGSHTDWDVIVERLETRIVSFQSERDIDRLRSHISDCCRKAADGPRGLRTLTAPTGAGKTLAQLRFALNHANEHNLQRVIFVVPFTSIIDQNADIARSILEPKAEDVGQVVIEHHSNLTPEDQTWRNKLLSENWDAPLIFTTMVQFLEALFGSGTRGVRRMHRLADAVIVFDEIQAVPIKCVHLFNNAMNFLVDHCGSSGVLSTATQPLLHRVDPVKGALRLKPGHELIPDVESLFRALKRVEVLDRRKPGGWSDEELADLALEQLDEASSCLVVVNTKGAARRLYGLCKIRTDHTVVHLSTSMCPAHRRAALDGIRNSLDQRNPILCISTQLIEAGVDVDFGAVVRFMAGLDSIAQSAGRCNRHGIRATGRIHVVNPLEENLRYLPDIRAGRDVAQRVLDEFREDPGQFGDDPIGPQAMTRYYDYYFFKRREEMPYPVAPAAVGRDDTLLNMLGENAKALNDYTTAHCAAPTIPLRQSFKAASQAFQVIEAATQGVLVPFGPGGRELLNAFQAAVSPKEESALLARAQQYSVNVFPYEIDRLQKACAVRESRPGTGIMLLYQTYYHPEFGLSTEPVADMEVLYV